jgi:hypothetical protein
MRDRLATLDKYYNQFAPEDPEIPADMEADSGHFSLGSNQGKHTFQALEEENRGNPAYDRFRTRLSAFFNKSLLRNDLPGGKAVKLAPDDQVRPQSMAYLCYRPHLLPDMHISISQSAL